MKTKIVKNYVYEGLGFPVELESTEMYFIDGDWHPKIDVQKVADDVIAKLAVQETRLTGHQVKFIRSYYSMPLREFGEKVVHESHMAVSKWEKKGDLSTNMNSNTEHELRLYIIEKLHEQSREPKSKFYDIYMATKRFFSVDQNEPTIIHAHN
jgi:DNA-binding transcriptional regulator YiaG